MGGVCVCLCRLRPLPHPLLILPRDAAQPRVELQVLLGRQLVKEGVELRTVAQTLLDLQKLLQDAVETESRAEHKARGSSLPKGSLEAPPRKAGGKERGFSSPAPFKRKRDPSLKANSNEK